MSLSQLSPELVEKAKVELNEDPDTRMNFIQELREKSKTRQDLRIEQADKDLIKFLRARKFDLDRAFDLMVTYYESKRDMSDLFTNYSPSGEIKAFESGFSIGFKDRDQEGRKIFAFRPGMWEPSERTLLDNLRANLIAIEMLLEEEETQICGIVIIGDFRGFGFKQAKAMSPSIFRSYANVLLNCFPVRIKGIHVIEQPRIFTIVFAIVSQFMKEKLRKRVYLHGSNIVGMHQHIAKSILPNDFGGDNSPTDVQEWLRFVLNGEEEYQHLWM
ncbi:alpha-tocopherol transfer protein-like [Clytia hemisphaerica]